MSRDSQWPGRRPLSVSYERTAGLPAVLRDRDFILSVATFEHKKDSTYSFAPSRSSEAPTTVVARDGGPIRGRGPDLRAQPSELGIAKDVVFCETFPMARWACSRACKGLLPAVPVGALRHRHPRAGAYRLPVVASRVGGIRSCSPRESGLLVEPEDSQRARVQRLNSLERRKLARDLGTTFTDAVRATSLGHALMRNTAHCCRSL